MERRESCARVMAAFWLGRGSAAAARSPKAAVATLTAYLTNIYGFRRWLIVSGKIKWKTVDGRRPSIYFMLTAHWRDGPAWVPFFFAAFFGFTLWVSPVLPQNFGPDPDYSRPVVADGHFGSRRSVKSFYKFTEKNGRIIYLSCWPRMLVNSCMDGVISPGEALRVEYAPMEPSVFRSESGVVLGLWRGSAEILNPAITKQHLTRHLNRFAPTSILLYILRAVPALILSVLFLSIICGMIEGTKRMIHALEPSRRLR